MDGHRTTELYLEYLANKRKCMKVEKWYWTYHVWMTLRGYARK